MLFLIVCKLVGEKTSEALEAFAKTCDMCGELAKVGKVKVYGPFADLSGGAVVVEAGSEEEVRRYLDQFPAKPYITSEVYQLASPDILKEAARKAK